MILWCSILLVVLANNNIKAEISIDSDGGYKNIVIGISPNLNKSDVESIIFKLRVSVHYFDFFLNALYEI